MNLITTDNLLERVRELTMIAKPTPGEVWELQELVNRLDVSLSLGGVLPTDWTHEKVARVFCINESVRPPSIRPPEAY